MGCGRNEDVRSDNNRHNSCICEVVRAIKRVQGIRDEIDCDDCRTDCFLTPLGSLVSPARQRANTRVFMLLDEKGNPFKAMFRRARRFSEAEATATASEQGRRDCNTCFSVFFRVQNVFDNCCATLQVLEPRDIRGRRVDLFKGGKLDLDAVCEVERFEATGTCVTVDLSCFCAVQCVKDVHIDCDED
ncbi:CotY/CotZ family spore coat protein [Sporosarcina highlanderae]|uniref:CotY/CotZ family spore coat protein n=1 Tax=Sporosarcina highlanderae TaxID=3035916 RepID=A0ABT8JP89_9BACL|nr:CotY/CotZ family spore coat protein [Sporosarcina highlanderae]MDN4606874.1 CotY/CotZ family spore coat protein [Sporosarcina highlanderae]